MEKCSAVKILPEAFENDISAISAGNYSIPSTSSNCDISIASNHSLDHSIDKLSSDESELAHPLSCSNESMSSNGYITDYLKSNENSTNIEKYTERSVKKDSNTEVKNCIRQRAMKHNITHNALSELLSGLKNTVESLAYMPSDARTLLKSSSVLFNKRVCEPGNYIHIGLAKQLKLILDYSKKPINSFKLIFNIDGLPLFKSSSCQVIPILFSVISDLTDIQSKVFPVGFYCGHGKPDNISNFLEEFVEEVKYLTENGITSINGISIPVEIVCFCCDSPAKSDILGTKGHGGYFSCTKCTV